MYNVQLSISIVNTNNKPLLKDCLQSIYDNTLKTSFEIIVVDNASTDGSVEMLEKDFPDVICIKNFQREGYGFSHNRAVEVAKGKYILIFNEDMIIGKNALDLMVSRMDIDNTIGALGCKLLNPDGSLQHSCFKFPTLGSELYEALFPYTYIHKNSTTRAKMYYWDHNDERDVDIIMGCCMLIPRSVIDEVGAFDTQFFVYSEEFDWCKRIKEAGYRITFFPEAEIIHYGGQTSKTMSVRMHLVMMESKYKYYKKHNGFVYAMLVNVIIGLSAIIRILGWSFYWAFNTGNKKKIAKGMLIRYSKTLGLLFGLTKPA